MPFLPHIAFCFASLASSIVNVGPPNAGSWLILTYGGMAMESSPSGPLTCTVDMACTLEFLALAEGATTWNVTPCGTESGNDPILD
jgi:hypothetical protein